MPPLLRGSALGDPPSARLGAGYVRVLLGAGLRAFEQRVAARVRSFGLRLLGPSRFSARRVSRGVEIRCNVECEM